MPFSEWSAVLGLMVQASTVPRVQKYVLILIRSKKITIAIMNT